jgi:hypothetical protein
MVSSGILRRVALVRIDVSEELSASFIRVTRIGEIGTTQAATSNRRTLRRNRFLQQPHGVTSQKTPFFIATVVKTSNLTFTSMLGENESARHLEHLLAYCSGPIILDDYECGAFDGRTGKGN